MSVKLKKITAVPGEKAPRIAFSKNPPEQIPSLMPQRVTRRAQC